MVRLFALLVATMTGVTASVADESNSLGISIYGSFLHTERVPNALFFFSDIEENDSFELRKAIRNHDIHTVVLSSKGGSVWEGLNMAGIISDKGLKTYVPQQALGEEGNCASACSFMFFGGSTRVADGKLGVHQFYSGSANESAQIGKTQSNAQFTVSEIIGFLNEFETPPFVFERMFQQKEMYYFNQNELEKIARVNAPITGDDVAEIDQFIADFVVVLANLEDTDEPEDLAPPEPAKVTPKKTVEEFELVKPAEEITKEIETTAVTETSEVTEKQLIKDIQSELNRLNCNAGKADGRIGPKTRSALQRYALANGITQSNRATLSIEFLEELKKSNTVCSSVVRDLICTGNYDRTPSWPSDVLRKVTIFNFTISTLSPKVADPQTPNAVKIEYCYAKAGCKVGTYKKDHDWGENWDYLTLDNRNIQFSAPGEKGYKEEYTYFYNIEKLYRRAFVKGAIVGGQYATTGLDDCAVR